MKKFYLLSSDNLNGLQGAANFINLLNDKNFWNKNHISVKAYSNSYIFSDPQVYQKSWQYHFKLLLKALLKTTNIGKRMKYFLYDMNTLGKGPVRQMGGHIQEGDWVLLNDINVASAFYECYADTKNTIFMMHNDGHFFSGLEHLAEDDKIRTHLLKLEKKIMDSATKIVFVSNKAQIDFITENPAYASKTELVYNGIDDVKCTVSNLVENRAVHFVTVGTVSKRKNQIALLQAIASLGRKDVELTIVGAGPEYKKCIRYCQRRKLEGQVHFAGARSDVRPFLNKADIFIMSSKSEGLPIAAQEALRSGLPLVLTDVGGCSELIDGNGILITPEIREIKRAIDYCAMHRELLKEWGERSYQMYKEKFSKDKMLEKYLQIVTDGGLKNAE